MPLNILFWVVFGVFGAGFQFLEAAEWIYFQNHLHTTSDHTFSRYPQEVPFSRSYDADGLRTLIRLAKESSIDSLGISDHNTISHWFDPVFLKETDVLLLHEEEWTNMFGGHAALLDYEASREEDAIIPPHPRGVVSESNYRDMIEEVHRRGGLVIINHPKSFYYPHRWPEDIYDADGIELNFLSFMLPDQVISWWSQYLKEWSPTRGSPTRGRKIFLLGGSDYHVGGNNVKEPFLSTNLVLVEEKTLPSLKKAIGEGRIQALRSPTSPKVFMTAIQLSNGESAASTLGDEIRLRSLQNLFLDIRVANGEGGELYLYNQRGLMKVINITSSDFSLSEIYAARYEKDFLRAEVYLRSQLETVINPIYISTF